MGRSHGLHTCLRRAPFVVKIFCSVAPDLNFSIFPEALGDQARANFVKVKIKPEFYPTL